jgi:HEAT repeat protein
LRQLLNDPLLTVRQAAANALAAITGQSPSHSAPEEKADITLNFQGMPLGQFLDFYEGWAGKKVAMVAAPNPGQSLRVLTPRPLTKSEAMQLFEELLKDQAGLVIVHGADGSLSAVAKP